MPSRPAVPLVALIVCVAGTGARTAARTGSSSPRLSSGCSGAISSKALIPNQLNTAYEVDELRTRGFDGSVVRVNTLSSTVVGMSDFRTWVAWFNQPVPKVTQFAMPGGVVDTQDDPDETVLDVEALATIAPRLERITPVFVPLDRNFGNSFILFMRGSLDPSGQGGELPDVLSISDGVCEYRFRNAEKYLGNRLLAEAAAIGITSLSASGVLGFQGCESAARLDQRAAVLTGPRARIRGDFLRRDGGTCSKRPDSPFGRSPDGGAAQPGYDLVTGLGSLRATAFADAVAATPPSP